MAEEGSDKTEAPTPRRQQEAREEGNIARSMDLTSAATMLAGVILLDKTGRAFFGGMRTLLESMLAPEASENPTRVGDIEHVLLSAGRLAVGIAAPMVLGLAGVALVITVAQVGFILTTKPLEPSLAKLNPLKGLANLFDARAGMRFVMTLFKVGIVGAIAAWLVIEQVPAILVLPQLEVAPLFAVACELVYALAIKLTIALLVLAVIDYAYQRWQRTRDLMMSKQEIKEEMRRMEGDPMIKQRRSRVARQLAMQRIGQAVPRADVVVTNPTHFAVALKYDAATMKAPKVVAKGADYLAFQIRQVATANNVPLVERKELARALYASVDVGREVPPEHYAAVAEILAYVYRLNEGRTPARAAV